MTKPETADDVRYEMKDTRRQLGETAGQLNAELSARAAKARERVNVIEMARRHPLLAVAIAVGAGVAIASSHTDEKAVDAAKSGSTKALDKARQLVDRDDESGVPVVASSEESESSPGPIKRFVDKQVSMLGDELRKGASEIA